MKLLNAIMAVVWGALAAVGVLTLIVLGILYL